MIENKIAPILENVIQIILGIAILFFPFFFLTTQTDFFSLPKQGLIIAFSILALIVLGIKTIFERKIILRSAYLDLPIFIFLIALLLSSLFAIDKYISLIIVIPFIFWGIFYFIFINNVKNYQSLYFFILTFIFTAFSLSIFQLLTFLKIYPLPFAFTHNLNFSPTGSLVDSAIFIFLGFLTALIFSFREFKSKNLIQSAIFAVCGLVSAVAVGFILVKILNQKILLLPFLPAFQIAFSELSQDTGRIAQGFFLGSGYGTFSTDFTRFKPTYFNLYPDIWYINFPSSFSFLFELITTTGILGLLAYIFIIIKVVFSPKEKLTNPFFIPIIATIIISLVLPFSFFTLSIFIFELTLFSVYESFKNPKETQFSLLAIRKNFFHENSNKIKESLFAPIVFVILILIFSALALYFSFKYVLSDYYFNNAINAASKNNANTAYQMDINAINTFPYRDVYYQFFSQTNMAIANSISALEKNKKNTQTQNTVNVLIKQSISSGQTAVSLAPNNISDWQNLASVYKSLIGFVKNADVTAIRTVKQTIVIDASNPQEYITLGGIYYSLGNYDNAILAFQTAINLKPDYANAYYNLGHSYEQKKDLTNALSALKIVRSLVAKNSQDSKKIDAEIANIEAKIAKNKPLNTQNLKTGLKTPSATVQQPLALPAKIQVSSPSSKIGK